MCGTYIVGKKIDIVHVFIYNLDMRMQHIQTLLMTVVIWLTIGVNIVCIWHCHTMHMELPGAQAFVCTHPTAPAHGTALPITHDTLTQLSQLILVTGVMLCVVTRSDVVWQQRCILVGRYPPLDSPPPNPYFTI
jgi:hypothetical protein